MKINKLTLPLCMGILMSITGSFSTIAGAQEGSLPTVGPNGFPVTSQPAAKVKSTRMIKMRPAQKRSLSMKLQERNPYAGRSEDQRESASAGIDSEEFRIRKKLSSIAVTGSSRGPNNDLKVQMGDIILEQGKVLPPMIEDQTVNLQVIELTEEVITLGWLDIETRALTGKEMMVPYDLSPRISYQLSGQVLLVKEPGAVTPDPLMGIMKMGKKRRHEAQRIAAKDPASGLAREIYEAAQ